MVGFWNSPKTKFMKNQLSPGVPDLQILVILGHEYSIESLYVSWTTHRYNEVSKHTSRAKVTRVEDNRSLAVLTCLPVQCIYIYIQCILYIKRKNNPCKFIVQMRRTNL